MKKRLIDLRWWALYLLVAGFLAVLWWVLTSPLSQNGQTAAGGGLLLVFFGLLSMWLRANDVVMLREEMDRRRSSRTSAGQIYTCKSQSEYYRPVSTPWDSSRVDSTRQLNATGVQEDVKTNGRPLQSKIDLPHKLR